MREDTGPVQWAGQQAVLALPERMEASNAGQIGEELLSVINGGATALIADMTATIWCDHAGADAVVRAFRRAVVSGIELRLVVPAEHVSRVLSLSGLDHLVPSYPSLEGATAASPPAAARMARARLASVSAEAVAMARRVGDRGVLAHAPYTQCFATWGPDTLAERATLGREPVDLAEDLRAPGLILAGRRWQVVNALEIGDVVAADQNIQAHVWRAAKLGQPLFQYWSAVLRSTRALMRGRFDEAEQLCLQALGLGQRLGSVGAGFAANAAAQLHVLRGEQGRLP